MWHFVSFAEIILFASAIKIRESKPSSRPFLIRTSSRIEPLNNSTAFVFLFQIANAQASVEKEKPNVAVKEEPLNQEVNESSPQKRPPTTSGLKGFSLQCDLLQPSKESQNRLKDIKETKESKDLKNADNEFIRDLKNQLK